MIGLSATPERKDGLTKLLSWFFGDIIIKDDMSSQIAHTIVKTIKNNTDYPLKYMTVYSGKQKLNIQDVISQLTTDDIRNKIIVDEVKRLISIGRQIIILTHRRVHAKVLQELIGPVSGLYIGSMKKEELDSNSRLQVIIGTYEMVSEGFDVPRLDTLILATPKSDVVQVCGRIRRQPNINTPYLIDIADKVLYNQYKKRYNFYKSEKYTFEEDEDKDEEDEDEEEEPEEESNISMDIFL
jgi:superfamily II DNA or RNA helicase